MAKSDNKALIEFIKLMKKWQRFLKWNIGSFTILALIISLLLPKWYKGEAKILTSGGGLGSLGLSSFVSNLPLGGLSLLPKSDESLKYLAILNSRTVFMKIINKYNLQERYDKPDWEKTFLELQDNTSFEINVDETISISAWDTSPELAADMTNEFVKLLDSLNIQLNVESAGNERKFLEERLEVCNKDLSEAEMKFKKFQEQNGVLEITEQAKAAIATISELEAMIILKETEKRFKNNYLEKGNAELKRLDIEVKEYKNSLRRLKQGEPNGAGESFHIPTNSVPELALQYFRLFRDVEIQNTILKFITQQYEQSKAMEAKQTPTIQVLDWAVPPVYKDYPKRAFIVIGAFIFSCLLSVAGILFLERWRVIKQELDE